jgi:hypothetical protein
VKALSAALVAHRYSELEKAIQKEADPVQRAALVRELNHAQRTARRSR